MGDLAVQGLPSFSWWSEHRRRKLHMGSSEEVTTPLGHLEFSKVLPLPQIEHDSTTSTEVIDMTLMLYLDILEFAKQIKNLLKASDRLLALCSKSPTKPTLSPPERLPYVLYQSTCHGRIALLPYLSRLLELAYAGPHVLHNLRQRVLRDLFK